MVRESPFPDIVARLHQNGYALLSGWRRQEATIAIGHSIGSVVDMRELLPRSKVPTVQTLVPRNKTASANNRYSGSYGLNEFPLHTDLAHWARPPRYFVLRCQKGSSRVATRLLTSSKLGAVLDKETLCRAVVRPRRVGPNATLCLLPLVFSANDICGFRWDPLFVVPMNAAAKQVAELVRTEARNLSESITLTGNGDTLIVDNWRVLHGRSEVSIADLDRRLERVYLSEIHT